MGFFKKIFKGIKKFVKKIGRGIKKTFMKVGKFMDKIGIVGQIAMAFILPGVGAMLGKTLAGLGTFGAGLAQSTNILARAAGAIIKGAANAASWVGRTFKTVSSAVSNHVGEFAKTAASKLGFNVKSAATNFFGVDGAFAKASQATGETWRSGFGSLDAISKSTTNVVNSMASANAPPAKPTWKAEDIYGPAKKAPAVGKGTGISGEIFAKQPSSLFTPEQKIASMGLDPELGMAQIEDIVTSGNLKSNITKANYNFEMGDNLSLPKKQQSLLGRVGDVLGDAKDRAVTSIQDKITNFQEKPIETTWDFVKSNLLPEEQGTGEVGGYPGMVADVLPMHSQAEFLSSQLYTMPNQYGNAAYLMDNSAAIYNPSQTWAQTMRNLT